jgi:CRP-like cAMP-binding protein
MLQPADVINLLTKQSEPQTFAPNEIIFKEGDLGKFVYGIIEGDVEMIIKGKHIETLKPRDVFGVGALVHEEHQRTSTAIAKTEVKLVYLDRERFMFAVQQNPVFALEVMRSYSDRFRNLKEELTMI